LLEPNQSEPRDERIVKAAIIIREDTMTDESKDDSTAPTTNNDGESSNPVASIRMVIQRYRKASLLIDETHVVTVGESESLLDKEPPASVGLLAYLSFAKTADERKVEQAAKTLLHLPILTLGAWGDGSTTRSMFQLLAAKKKDDKKSSSSIVLVPQANLIAKVKNNGKSMQYNDQIEKSQGKQLYDFFCETIRKLLVEHQSICRGETKAINPNKPTTPDPSIPPKELFRQDETYGSFDEYGLPLTMVNGDPVTKSARKKIKKVYDSQVKRHEKYLQQESKPVEKVANEPDPKATLDTCFVQFVAGSFGKRQGLELYSDMGPFCHVIEI
jgi:D-Tyr-tRNAtyr deacylase